MLTDPILATLIAQRSGAFLPVYDHDPGDEDDSAEKQARAMSRRVYDNLSEVFPEFFPTTWRTR